jgi:hypothetical protein
MGTPARAHGVGTPGIYLGLGPWEYRPKIGSDICRTRIRKQYVNLHSTVNLYRNQPEPWDLDTYKEGP